MILLTGLLALVFVAATTADGYFVKGDGLIRENHRGIADQRHVRSLLYPHKDSATEKTPLDFISPIERVQLVNSRWPENYLFYEGNEELFDTTYAPHAVILLDGKLYGIGVKDFTKKFPKYRKNAISVNVDRKYELQLDGTVIENFKFYLIINTKSLAFVGESYWKEIDGQYKVVFTSYRTVDHLL